MEISSDNIRARLLPMFPFSIMQGGLELQCVKTCAALRRIGVSAELLDYYQSHDQFDILHLFGSTENYYDLCRQAVDKWPIIISAVSGAPSVSWWRAPVWQTASNLARSVKLHTNYQRLRSVYHMASTIICLNQLEADFLGRTYFVAPDRIEIVNNGVDEENFQADRELFVQRYGLKDFVLYTGNIIQRKNPLSMALALRELGYPGVFIGKTVASEQRYGDEFASIVAQTPNLHWIQGLTHDDPLLASAYAAANALCLPSSSETQSLSALEAMAAGIPVILGDFPYAYQSPFEHCLRCDPMDINSIKSCLSKARQNASFFRVALPASYRWVNVASRIKHIYRRILDNQ